MKKVLALSAIGLMCVAQPVHAGEHYESMSNKIDEKFEMMDTNRDGSISAQEHETGTKQMFADADTSGDHMLSRTEVTKHMENMKQKWQKTRSPKEIVQ
jgi:EF hand